MDKLLRDVPKKVAASRSTVLGNCTAKQFFAKEINIMLCDYDYLFKLLLIGDSGVGKSSLLMRFAEDTYSPDFISTIGVDFRVKTVKIGEDRLRLQLWDSAGQERFRTITSSYYRGAHGIILVYDVGQRSTFNHLESWLGEIDRYAHQALILVIGQKSDLPDCKRQVSHEEAKHWAKERGLELVEVSAKESDNVNETFLALARRVRDKHVGTSIVREQSTLLLSTEAKKRRCC
jgi:Ras-related protein Rab-1A